MGMDFHQTVMGRQFYECTMPAMVRQLAELSTAIQQLVELAQQGVAIDKERMAKKEADNIKQD